MGQKVSPIGLRLGINKDWKANWFSASKDFAGYLASDIKIRKYLDKKLKNAAVSSVIIQRNSKVTDVIINTAKPGVIIGHGGEEIEKLKKQLSSLVNENIQVSVVEVKVAELSAQLVASSIAIQIENRISYRVAQKKAIRNTMRVGAKGIKTLVAGRLNGVEIARSEGYSEGTIPLHTLRADIDYGFAEADTTYGKLGVKVWIYKGEILPTRNKGGNKNVDAKED